MAKDYHCEEENAARAFYLKIGSVSCPILGGSIAFGRTGFHHLIRKHGRLRRKDDQRRRFALLQYAPDIISNPRADIVPKTRGRANFWLFKEERDGRTVKVIVRQLKGGKKHFYSVFADKKKPLSD